ncbi:MAG: hypothetical protein E6H40_01500 [Betaproteobacteria bacterium]|nr:MAG: hypothetical protein E6H40_01500 [Betaproteobacteria bacterium]
MGAKTLTIAALAAMALAGGAPPCRAAEPAGLPGYLSDRGDGIPTSLLGTYIREKEFLFYPFYEYTRFRNFEYSPKDLGVRGPREDDKFFGKRVEREGLVFLAYAFSDSLAVEFESAVYSSVDFTMSADDNTAVPDPLRERGLGDTEANIRWRYSKETATRPEAILFLKTVFPLQKNKALLGSKHLQLEPGIVLTKGFSFGTLALRGSANYDRGERKLSFSGYAVDYVKRLSPAWRVAFSLEGHEDELSAIGEVQYTLSKNAVLKLNSGFGVTKKAPTFAPEIGVLFTF